MGDPEDQAAAYVLGDDGDWRRLDVAGLTPVADGYDRMYTSSVVRPTGLDPSGTRLAIPQLDTLVVVDLTTGESEEYDVPGPRRVLVAGRDRRRGVVGDGGDRYVVGLGEGSSLRPISSWAVACFPARGHAVVAPGNSGRLQRTDEADFGHQQLRCVAGDGSAAG